MTIIYGENGMILKKNELNELKNNDKKNHKVTPRLSNTTASNTIDKIDQSNQLVEVQKFVRKLKCLNKENYINIKNEDYRKRINRFFSILDKWEAAGIEVSITSIDIKFGDIDDEKYKKKMKATCKWTAKYIKIYNLIFRKLKLR